MDDTHNLWMTLSGKAIKQHLPAKNQRYFTESLSILQPYLTAPAHVGFLPPIPDNTSSSQYFLKLPVVFLEDGMLRYRRLLFKHNALSFLLLIEDPPTTSPPLKPTTVRPSALFPHFAQFSFSQMEKDISNLAFSTARFFEQRIENPFEEEKLKGVRYLFINHFDLLLHNTITTQSQP
ncbi:hypothetical protein BLNAU_15498 [Blattamonas nauphoetae]|uniref:Uncharacterized protein n=1 Tax=Blattamonas nauphoetae TaxID=2049346 RepID=A0ABQ9XC60_9EUKA|nr:hypothetical protein BLNAU_15498 [Blattamonas nauphoetae]